MNWHELKCDGSDVKTTGGMAKPGENRNRYWNRYCFHHETHGDPQHISARLPRPRTASGHGCHGCHGSRFGERRGRWLRPRQHRSIDRHTWFGNDMEMTWIRLVWRCLKISKNDQTCIYWCILYTAVYYTYIIIYIHITCITWCHMISHDQMMYSSSYAHVAAICSNAR